MPAWICATCAVQYAETDQPPQRCPICEDERQYVGWEGQRWTTMTDLALDHSVELREEEPDLLGVGVQPAVAIGQRALLVRTRHGNVLWDCVPLLDDAAQQHIADLGGIDAICLSHPHFYAAHVDFADAFDAQVLIPRADQQWIQRPSPRIELFDDEVEPVPGVTLARIGGPFRRCRRPALGRRLERPWRPTHRRHHLRRPGPQLGQLHVELPQPDPPRCTHRSRHRPPCRVLRLRPCLRRLVGASSGPRRLSSGTPLRRALHRPTAWRTTTELTAPPATTRQPPRAYR